MLKIFLLIPVFIFFLCAPVQEMYISKSGATTIQNRTLDKAKVISRDTLSSGLETVVRIKYRLKSKK